MWGPIVYGPGPLAYKEPAGPNRRRPGPKLELWSPKRPTNTAEDCIVLGRSKIP